MAEAQMAIIGGTGVYQMEGLQDVEEVRLSTPFGDPSDAIVLGTVEGRRLAFLPRHGRGHRIAPNEVNQRANIFALKTLGVERIVSISAVGSMREDVWPLDVVIPDQLVDRTRERPSTFFGGGLVAHIGFADPFCPHLREELYRGAREHAARVHRGGTYICVEGPRFSTRAESRIYRQWGVDVIGMTAIPEAVLAREAEMCYATLAFVTDYDVWHVSEEPVSVEMIVGNLLKNAETAKRIIRTIAPRLAGERQCECGRALESAVITAADRIPADLKTKLAPLIGKYL